MQRLATPNRSPRRLTVASAPQGASGCEMASSTPNGASTAPSNNCPCTKQKMIPEAIAARQDLKTDYRQSGNPKDFSADLDSKRRRARPRTTKNPIPRDQIRTGAKSGTGETPYIFRPVFRHMPSCIFNWIPLKARPSVAPCWRSNAWHQKA